MVPIGDISIPGCAAECGIRMIVSEVIFHECIIPYLGEGYKGQEATNSYSSAQASQSISVNSLLMDSISSVQVKQYSISGIGSDRVMT